MVSLSENVLTSGCANVSFSASSWLIGSKLILFDKVCLLISFGRRGTEKLIGCPILKGTFSAYLFGESASSSLVGAN